MTTAGNERSGLATYRDFIAEVLGTGLVLAGVVGSGIMGEQLAGGNTAVALLANTIATGAILFVLISILGPVSGAHFNPVVSLAMCLAGKMMWNRLWPYIVCIIVGAVLGVWLAHAMFDLPVLQYSTKLRWGLGQWIAEAVATFGLLMTIFGGIRFNASAVPALVGFYITAAYWFTASTSFANPAVALARSLANTFSGIAPACVIPFIIAQLCGTAAAVTLGPVLFAADFKA
jgi:glycerol uptake facilitator-like aquaporin